MNKNCEESQNNINFKDNQKSLSATSSPNQIVQTVDSLNLFNTALSSSGVSSSDEFIPSINSQKETFLINADENLYGSSGNIVKSLESIDLPTTTLITNLDFNQTTKQIGMEKL